MRDWFKRLIAGLLVCGLALVGCGGDDDEDSPTGSEPQEGGQPEEVAAFTGALMDNMTTAFFAAIMGDTTLADGSGTGTLEIEGSTWTFRNYSSDGLLIINGVLTVMMDALPIAISGELALTGPLEGAVVVDMEVTLLFGQEPPLAVTGSITFDGEVYDVAALMAGEADEEE